MKDNKFIFDSNYVKYWNDIQKNSDSDEVRKNKVPSDDIAAHYISLMNLKMTESILDLGCSFGRLYSVISKYSKNIYGVDVNLDAINEAKKYDYRALVKGSAEDTNFASEYFDAIICWAVYDVVDQTESLIEENRVLKKGGKLLITGKNVNYELGDRNAFIAERNAKLKSFPNHFTDVYKLIDNISIFGFRIINGFGFKERGHLASCTQFDITGKSREDFYEYVLLLEKVSDVSESSSAFKFSYDFSNVAKSLSKKHDYDNIMDFFNFHKDKFVS